MPLAQEIWDLGPSSPLSIFSSSPLSLLFHFISLFPLLRWKNVMFVDLLFWGAQPIEQGSKRVSNSVRGVGSGLKVFIFHCKRISGTEDKAIWIADVLDSSEVDVKAWFDLKIKPTWLFQDSRCLFQDSRCMFQDSRCLFQDSRCLFQDSRCLFQDSPLPLARQPSQKY